MKSFLLTCTALTLVACAPADTDTPSTTDEMPAMGTPAPYAYTPAQTQVYQAFGWTHDVSKISAVPLKDGFAVIFGKGGNILVSVGDDGVLLVDDQLPEVHETILAEVKKLGGERVDRVINTHWHFDHAEGNRAFGPLGAEIIAQKNSADYMARANDVNLVSVTYPQQAYPAEALPSKTFGETMTMTMNGEEISLYNFGPAHTTGDAVVHFKTSNMIHMGDVANLSGLVFIDADNGGTIAGMIKTVRETLALIDDQTIVVPGHGEIANKAALESYASNLETVMGRIAAQMEKGLSLPDIQALNLAEDLYGPAGAMLVDRAYNSMK